MTGFIDSPGSPELEEHEVICERTGLAYDKRFHSSSPFVDEDGDVYFGDDRAKL